MKPIVEGEQNNPDAIKIIRLDNSHCKEVKRFILPIQQIEFGVPVTLEDQPDLLDIEGFYKSFWGAELQGEIIGTIGLMLITSGIGVIRKMFVQKEYRGKEKGIAQRLLTFLIDDCRRQEIRELYLGTVDILKAAISFYEKNGFEKIEKEALPQGFTVMSSDNIFYCLKL